MNEMHLQPETRKAIAKLPGGTVAHKAHLFGLAHNEPLLLAMDGLLRYAKAHKKRYEGNLSDDYVLGPAWLKAAISIRYLLNGNGAVALEFDLSTDSKDNGVIEETFWAAMNAAGFKESDMN